jgi:hypothetical protein
MCSDRKHDGAMVSMGAKRREAGGRIAAALPAVVSGFARARPVSLSCRHSRAAMEGGAVSFVLLVAAGAGWLLLAPAQEPDSHSSPLNLQGYP